MHRKILFVTIVCGLVALVAQPSLMAAAGPTLTGSWQLTFTPTAPPTPPVKQVPGLATFTNEGTVIETDGSELVLVPSSTAPAAASPGHGIWQKAPIPGEFYIEYISILVNSDGMLFGDNVTTVTGVTIATANNVTTFKGSYTTDLVTSSGTTRSSAGTVSGLLIPHPKLP